MNPSVNQMNADSSQNENLKTFTEQEIEILAKQAGEQAALTVQHANAQIKAGIVKRPEITPEQAGLQVKHTEDAARQKYRQMSEMHDMMKRHQTESEELRRVQAAQMKALEPPPAKAPAKPAT